jgi:hypothetical protein
MFHTIESVEPLRDFNLYVVFRTGEKKIYNVSLLIEKYEPFQSFKMTRGLFEQVKVAGGGYGVYWNDEIDISCNELYVNGKDDTVAIETGN